MKTYIRKFAYLAVLLFPFVSFSAEAQPTTYFVYDESGHVIGEYDANGNPIQEHVYLGDRPVAVVQGGSVDYVTTDQLDTPRVVTDASTSVVWSWSSDPFGNGQPTGSITYNLRFPGQYYDAETGHNYNHERDYDSNTGRYIESDPIGLDGGINTYTYVYNNPVTLIDPSGLVANPAEATCIDPAQPICWGGVAADIVSQIIITAAASKIASECPKNGKCPPCSPPVGTVGYRLDVVPPSKPHYPLPGTHVHLYEMNQNPNNCQCFWKPIGVTAPPPPPGAVPLG